MTESKKGALELVEFARPRVTVLQTPQGEFYAQYTVNMNNGSASTATELQPTRSIEFRQYLQKAFMDDEKTLLAAPTIVTAIDYLEADARYNGKSPVDVFVRVASLHNGKIIYVDLGDKDRTVIEITENGWGIAQNQTPHFYRPKSMRALPHPKRDGDLRGLKSFLGLVGNEYEETWATCMAWAVSTFHPTGPYPILAVCGSHGALKSSVCRWLKLLTDPCHPLLGGQPRDAEIVNIRARNSHVLTFDNLSYLPDWLSDLMCRIATGAGDSTRKFFENTGEVIFEAKRPIIYNSIEEISRRADLLDRSYMVNLPGIPKEKRKDEATLQQEFEKARPKLLGALYDVVSCAIKNLPTVDRSNLSRMADAELWTRASESCYTVQGTFAKAHANSEIAAVAIELESSLVAKGIRDFVSSLQGYGQSDWNGLAEELYKKIEAEVGDKAKGNQWPKSANHFTSKIRRHAPSLRKVGIDITSHHTEHGTEVHMEFPLPTPTQITGSNTDDTDDTDDKFTNTSSENATLKTHPSLEEKISRVEDRKKEEVFVNTSSVASVSSADDIDLSLNNVPTIEEIFGKCSKKK